MSRADIYLIVSLQTLFKYINRPDMLEVVHLIWMTRSTATASICLAQGFMCAVYAIGAIYDNFYEK